MKQSIEAIIDKARKLEQFKREPIMNMVGKKEELVKCKFGFCGGTGKFTHYLNNGQDEIEIDCACTYSDNDSIEVQMDDNSDDL